MSYVPKLETSTTTEKLPPALKTNGITGTHRVDISPAVSSKVTAKTGGNDVTKSILLVILLTILLSSVLGVRSMKAMPVPGCDKNCEIAYSSCGYRTVRACGDTTNNCVAVTCGNLFAPCTSGGTLPCPQGMYVDTCGTFGDCVMYSQSSNPCPCGQGW